MQFVAFRIGEILESSEVNEWRYVPTTMNVADEATKWVDAPSLTATSRWFTGPGFLRLPAQEWPKEKPKSLLTAEIQLRSHYHHQEFTPNATPDPSHFERWPVLLRSQALVLRVLTKKSDRQRGVLTAKKLRRAEKELFRTAQLARYPEEIFHLKQTPLIPVVKNSKLYCLSPFLDIDGVLRMTGRTTRAVGITEDAKNPILLPNDHKITDLLLTSYHRRYHHHNN